MPRTWTPEQKAAQAAKIRRWRPWEASTGPRTPAGKAASARNAITHGLTTAQERADLAMLRRALAAQAEFLSLSLDWIHRTEASNLPHPPTRHCEKPPCGDEAIHLHSPTPEAGLPRRHAVPPRNDIKGDGSELFTPPDTSDA